MEKLGAKLETFNQAVKDTIQELLETKGVRSRFDNSCLVLVIQDDNAMFNLDSRRYLVEISEDELIDNEGYRYGFESLKLEDLCIAIDSVIDGITPNFRIETQDENGCDSFEYFEGKQEAYTKFVQIQSNGTPVSLGEREEEFDRHGMPKYNTINEHLGEDED